MKLSDLIPQIEQLASQAPEARDVCWLQVGDTDAWPEFCPECARKIIAWLCDNGERPNFAEHEDYPDYANINREDNYYVYSYGYLSDGSICCEHCGHLLHVDLTTCGVESEIEHFESWGMTSPEDWQCFRSVCDAIRFIECDWYPLPGAKESETKKERELYDRALKLAIDSLPVIA